MKYLHTTYRHYRKFVAENKSDRLDKGLKIFTSSKNLLINDIFNSVNEIYDKIPTDYILLPNSKYNIIFNSNKYKYRLDIVPKYEYDRYINHIAFSDVNATKKTYDDLLDRHETLEVLNRIKFIIIDLINKKIIDNDFCIGATELQSKNDIYEYMLKVLVGEEGFTKQHTNYYNSKWGLYFKI